MNKKLTFFFTLCCLILTSSVQPASGSDKKQKATSYQTFKHINLSKLSPKQKDLIIDLLNHNDCKCGCKKDSLAHCVETDTHCSQSKFLSQELIDQAVQGKDRSYLLGVIDGFNHAKKHTKLTKKKQKRPVDKKIYPVKTGSGSFIGSEKAPVTLIEFTDYQCPFCKRGHQTVKKLMAAYPGKIKLYVRNNPLPFHKRAEPAALAALAAEQQGKFAAMHELLFSGRGLKDSDFIKYAKLIKLDMKQFQADLKNPTLTQRIKDDRAEAHKHGASGTPAFFLNGHYLRGAKPLTVFTDLVDKLLQSPQPVTKKK